jgi:osmotically-inducible protein OsmY
MTEDFYVAERIKRALAEDPRTHELAVRAEIEGDTVVLRGEVAGAERRQLVAEVAAAAAPGMAVRNEVSVPEVLPPEETAT